MLNARWKGASKAVSSSPEPLGVGQIRSFRIAKIDRDAQIIEVKLA
jgi:small subunit ribosomal protein S1